MVGGDGDGSVDVLREQFDLGEHPPERIEIRLPDRRTISGSLDVRPRVRFDVGQRAILVDRCPDERSVGRDVVNDQPIEIDPAVGVDRVVGEQPHRVVRGGVVVPLVVVQLLVVPQ